MNSIVVFLCKIYGSYPISKNHKVSKLYATILIIVNIIFSCLFAHKFVLMTKRHAYDAVAMVFFQQFLLMIVILSIILSTNIVNFSRFKKILLKVENIAILHKKLKFKHTMPTDTLRLLLANSIYMSSRILAYYAYGFAFDSFYFIDVALTYAIVLTITLHWQFLKFLHYSQKNTNHFMMQIALPQTIIRGNKYWEVEKCIQITHIIKLQCLQTCLSDLISKHFGWHFLCFLLTAFQHILGLLTTIIKAHSLSKIINMYSIGLIVTQIVRLVSKQI